MVLQVILTSVLKLSIRARRFKEAATIADMLREGGTSRLDSKTVCTLISAYGATGNIRAAEEVRRRGGREGGKIVRGVYHLLCSFRLRSRIRVRSHMQHQCRRGGEVCLHHPC